MNELEIQGKKYISSKRAAELTGYAKDYVGQLARAGKVPGTRVGRAWYVEESALLLHARSDADQRAESASEAGKPIVSPLQPRRAVISPATLKAFGYGTQKLPDTWTSAVYFSDDADLIPRIQKYQENKPQNIKLPGTAVRIKIVERPAPRKPSVAESVRIISEKARKIRNKRRFQDTALSLGAITAALGILLFFSSGFILSSHVSASQGNGVYVANIAVGFQYAQDTLMKFPPFAVGMHSLESFFNLIGNSFYAFLSRGSAYIFWLFRWFVSLV